MNETTKDTEAAVQKQKKGLAMASKRTRAEIARMGGLAAVASGRKYKWNSETAKLAGSKGGLARMRNFKDKRAEQEGKT